MKIALLTILILSILVLPFAFSQTTIELNRTNGGYIKAAEFDEDNARNGNEGFLRVGTLNGTGELAFLGWNFSGIPDGSIITNISFYTYDISGANNIDIDLWFSQNETWVEQDIDDECSASTYCSDLDHFFDTFIFTLNPSSAYQEWNSANLTSTVNTAFQSGQRNMTFLMNGTGASEYNTASEDYTVATFRTYMLVTYEAGTVAPNLTNFTTPYYNFSVGTDANLYNLSETGAGVTVKSSILNIFDDTNTSFDITNVTIKVVENTSLLLRVGVDFYLSQSSNEMGYCNQTILAYKNNETLWVDGICSAYDENISIYGLNSTITPTDADFTGAYNVSGVPGTWEEYNLTGSSNTYYDRAILTNYATWTHDFMRMINTSNGYFIVGAPDRCTNLDGSGDTTRCSFNWAYEDRDDTSEVENVAYNDFVNPFAQPNKTIIVYDDSTPKVVYGFTWDGLSGYTPPTDVSYELRPALEASSFLENNVVKDTFHYSYFLKLGNSSTNYQTNLGNFRSDATYTSGELVLIGSRLIPNMGIPTGVSIGAAFVDLSFSWHTQSHLKRDMGYDNQIELMQHYLACREALNDVVKGNGWWEYDPIYVSGYGATPTYFGNAYERMDSCFKVLSSDLATDYPSTFTDLKNTFLSSFTALKLNDADLIGRQQNISVKINDDIIEFNQSEYEFNPWFKSESTGQYSGVTGDWRIQFSPAQAPNEFLLNRAVCTATNGTVLWNDDFSTDNSSSYTLSASGDASLVYNSTLGGMHCILTGSNSCIIDPVGTNAWVNYTCDFGIKYLLNMSEEVKAYAKIFIRYNGTDTRNLLYRVSNDESALFSEGSNRLTTWAIRDITQGVYDNDWGAGYENENAYFGIWDTVIPWENAVNGAGINNIQIQYAMLDSELCYMGNTSACNRVDYVLEGINWATHIFHNVTYQNCTINRDDGFPTYSKQFCNKDGDYGKNYFSQNQKLLRVSNGSNRLDHFPFNGFYGRYGRFNQSEAETTTTYYKPLAWASMVDTRMSQFRFPASLVPGYDSSIEVDNRVFFLMHDEFNKAVTYKTSNCSDAFAGKVGNYYPDDSIKIDSSVGLLNVVEVCDPVRIKNVSNITINDAWQTEGTTDTYIDFSMIPEVTTSCDFSLIESYPYCPITSNTNWSYQQARFWCSSGTCNITSGSYIVNNASSHTIYLRSPMASSPFSIYVNGTFNQSIGTDATGNATTTLSIAAESTILIVSGNYTPAPPTQYQYVVSNTSNGTTVNLSDISSFLAGGFVSWNESVELVQLWINGSLEQSQNISNNTYTAYNISSITAPGDYVYFFNSSYNTTGTLSFTVTNTTGLSLSDNASANHYLTIVIGIFATIAVLIFFGSKMEFQSLKLGEIHVIKFGVWALAGWLLLPLINTLIVMQQFIELGLENTLNTVYNTLIIIMALVSVFVIISMLMVGLRWLGNAKS